MSDAECPYCGEDTEINHDDGYGYSESELHEQECQHCDRTFTYRTSISYDYETKKADCLNGGRHDYVEVTRYRSNGPVRMWQCKDCEKEVTTLPAYNDKEETP